MILMLGEKQQRRNFISQKQAFPSHTIESMRVWSSLLWAGMAAATATSNNAATTTAIPPNIIFIMMDDVGFNDISYISPNTPYPTLYIDALAHSGI